MAKGIKSLDKAEIAELGESDSFLQEFCQYCRCLFS